MVKNGLKCIFLNFIFSASVEFLTLFLTGSLIDTDLQLISRIF